MFYEILTFFATPVLADDYGLKATADAAALSNFGDNLPGFIGNALGTALSLVGVLFFALMLYGGITWMMAHGNAEQEKKALSTITAAIIGILIVLGSYALTSFVLSSVKSAGDKAPKLDSPPPAPPKINEDCLKLLKKELCVSPCTWAIMPPLASETCFLPTPKP